MQGLVLDRTWKAEVAEVSTDAVGRTRSEAAETATLHDMQLRVGISTPWDLWRLSPDEQRRRLCDIADAQIDDVFTADHVSFRDGSGIDGLIHLAAMSGIEPRLGLHVGVYLLALRHPMIAARQIASLAQAAPGRLTVGVGVGGEDRHEIEVCDVDPRTRGRRTDVALGLVRALLDGATPLGDADDIVDFLVPYVDAGATTLNLTPCGPNPDVELQTIAEVRRILAARMT